MVTIVFLSAFFHSASLFSFVDPMSTSRVILKHGKDKAVRNRHPWIFSGAVDQMDSELVKGDIAEIYAADNAFLGVGYFNPESQIVVRMLAFEKAVIDDSFFEKKISEAVKLRERLLSAGTNAYRLIHAEGDFLPGLIVDRYADHLVVQISTAGMEKWKAAIVKALTKHFPNASVYEKSDVESRKHEGLARAIGVLAGNEPPAALEIQENGLLFDVDIKNGQKTGFFLDQRENRMLVKDLSAGRKILNCFAYTGGFSVYAAKGGASSVLSVESSALAVELGKRNLEKNGFSGEKFKWVQEDVFEFLRKGDERYDLIVLDPPAFCKSKQQVQHAARGYKDINMLAMKKLAPGGLLFTFSCSGHISPDLFQKIVFGAAKDVGRNVRIIKKTGQPFDHPVNIFHPEGEYLKGLLCEVA